MSISEPAFGNVGLTHQGPTLLRADNVDADTLSLGFSSTSKAIGDYVLQRAKVQKDLDEKASVDDATSQLMHTQNKLLYDPEAGFYTKTGKNAIDSYNDTIAQLDASRADIASKLSPKAQVMFDADSRRMQEYAEMDASRYAASQKRAYWKQSSEALRENRLSTMALNYNDSTQFDTNMAAAQDDLAHTDALDGVAPEVHKLNSQKLTSQAWSLRLDRMSDFDPVGAHTAYQANINKFTFEDQVKMDHMFENTLGTVFVDNAAKNIMLGQGTASIDKLWDVTKPLETKGGTDQAAVSPLNQGQTEHAYGVSQLLTSTAQGVARQMGIPWDEKLFKATTPEGEAYNERLGKGYLEQNFQKYSGDPVLTSLAYIAGPARVDQWMQKYGDPRIVGNAAFVTAIDKAGFHQSAERAVKVLENIQTLPGTKPTDIDPTTHLPVWMKQAQETYGNGKFGLQVQHSLQTNIGIIKKEIDSQRRDSYMSLLQTVDGGPLQAGPKVTHVADLLSNPDTKAQWLNLSPSQRDTLQQHMLQVAGGKYDVTPEGKFSYNRLTGLAVTDPGAFTAHDIMSEKGMDMAMRQKLIAKQTQLAKKPASNEFIQKAITISKQVVPDLRRMEANEPDDFNAYVGRLNDEINSFQTVHGRLPNDSDVRKLSGTLMQTEGGFLGMGSQYGFQAKPGEVEGLPFTGLLQGKSRSDLSDLRAFFRRTKGRDPTEQELSSAYDMATGYRASQGAASK